MGACAQDVAWEGQCERLMLRTGEVGNHVRERPRRLGCWSHAAGILDSCLFAHAAHAA